MNRAIADKELIEYKDDVYVDCRKNKGEASYNSCVDYIRDEGNGKFTVVIAVKMSPSDDTFYREFVHTDYLYWERSEWSFLSRIRKQANPFSRRWKNY